METILKTLLEVTDPIVLLGMISAYLVITKKIELVKKDVERIDKSTNHRKEGEITLSQEVSQMNSIISKLYTKTEITNNDLIYIKNQIDEHRATDEKIFVQLANDIRLLSEKVTPKIRIKKI